MLESTWIVGFFSKLFFTFIYLGIYAIRPLVVRPKAASECEPRVARDWAACMLQAAAGGRVQGPPLSRRRRC